LTREDFLASAKSIYAEALFLRAKEEARNEGQWNIPSVLLNEKEIDVEDGEISLKELNVLYGIPDEKWIVNIGGLNCGCNYVKTNTNRLQVLCDDDSLDDTDRRFYVLGKKIKFPDGTHSTKLSLTYAGTDKINDKIEIDEALGSLVRRELINLYGNKIGPEDTTNNSNNEK
jgi:hypothetical protein